MTRVNAGAFNTGEGCRFEPSVMTVGKFEGLHRGHQKLLGQLKKISCCLNLPTAVLTFDPHPFSVLRGGYKPLFTSGEKARLLEGFGIDVMVECPFDENFMKTEAEEFIRLIFSGMDCRSLVVGEGFRYGYGKRGDIGLLREKAVSYGAGLVVLENEMIGAAGVLGQKISTQTIREHIAGSDFKKAEELLGFPYFAMGEVVRGNNLGASMGYPTINILPEDGKLLPADGVYATETRLDGGRSRGRYGGVTNVGFAPTVAEKDGGRRIETYLFGFTETAYGLTAEVIFRERLRGEIKFSSLEELAEQIGRDEKKAREILHL